MSVKLWKLQKFSPANVLPYMVLLAKVISKPEYMATFGQHAPGLTDYGFTCPGRSNMYDNSLYKK